MLQTRGYASSELVQHRPLSLRSGYIAFTRQARVARHRVVYDAKEACKNVLVTPRCAVIVGCLERTMTALPRKYLGSGYARVSP